MGPREAGGAGAGVTVLSPTEALLRFCVTWNTNSRHCHEAQAVLGVLLRHEAPDELLTYDGVRASLEGLLPYTGEWAGRGAGRAVRHTRPPLTACGPPPERHFQRLSRMLQAATFLDFLWHNMKLHPPHGPRGPVKHRETQTLLSWLPVSVLTSSHPLVLGHSWPTPRPALQHRHGSVSQESFTQGTPGARSPASPTSTAPPTALRPRQLLAVIPGLWSLGWSLGSGVHSTALHDGPRSLRGLPAAVPYG